jgi:hypothetical protein
MANALFVIMVISGFPLGMLVAYLSNIFLDKAHEKGLDHDDAVDYAFTWATSPIWITAIVIGVVCIIIWIIRIL